MDFKTITIPHTGPIYAKGGVYGPITTPYREDVQTIGAMLLGRIKVNEVLEDGTEVELTLAGLTKKVTDVEHVPQEEIEAKEKAAQEEAARLAKEKEEADKAEADRLAKEKEEAELAELLRIEEEEKKKQEEAAKQQQQGGRQQNGDKKNNNKADIVEK